MRSALNHHPVPVRILKRTALLTPVRIERFNVLEARTTHRLATFYPGLWIGNVKDQQILGRRTRRHRMRAADGELEVEIRSAKAQHGSIETIVVRKAGKLFQAEALLVLGDGAGKIQHGACDAQVRAHEGVKWCQRTPHYSHPPKWPPPQERACRHKPGCVQRCHLRSLPDSCQKCLQRLSSKRWQLSKQKQPYRCCHKTAASCVCKKPRGLHPTPP